MMVGLVPLLHLAEMETHSIATWRGKEDLKMRLTTKCQNLIIIQENLRHGNEEEELKVRIISSVSHHLKEPLVMESGLLILIHLGSLVLDHLTNGWSARNLLGHNLVGFLQVKVFPKENKVISFVGSQRQITRVLVAGFHSAFTQLQLLYILWNSFSIHGNKICRSLFGNVLNWI